MTKKMIDFFPSTAVKEEPGTEQECQRKGAALGNRECKTLLEPWE